MTALRWTRRPTALLAIVLLALAMGCGSGQPVVSASTQVNVTTFVSASEGLNLQAVGELLKKVKDAEGFEELLNSQEEGINNLDLDEDGNVDFIKVTELGDGSQYREGQPSGFSLTVDMGDGQVQEIASIDMERTSDNVSVQIQGNEQVYGQDHYHRSRFGFSDYLLFSYMFRPHPFYHSRWGYGLYPGYYRPYGPVGIGVYRTRVSSATRNSTMERSTTGTQTKKATNPNKGKTSQKVKAPLKSPTTSQKAFQARNPSKQVKSGGFGSSRARAGTSGRSAGAARRSGGPSRGGK